MYFVERDKMAWQPVKEFLESFRWLPINEADAQWAFAQFAGDDYEDALQVACSIRENCDKFVTLDKSLFKKYSMHTKTILLN